MKQLFLTFLLASMACNLFAARYYVSPNATGSTGDSWENTISIHAALALTVAGDEIWALEGTYLSSLTGNRGDRLTIPSGVAVYGSFNGTEHQLEERNLDQNPSRLSGDLGIVGDPSDNAYTIVYIADASKQTVLDGFTILNGQAKARSRDRSATTCGGALVIEAISASSSPKIINCSFVNNNARYGGAVYVNGTEAKAEPQFVDCVFRDNEASFKGGALYNDGETGIASPVLVSCDFLGNDADYGAGIFNNGTNGQSNPLILESNFIRNTSMVNGAAIYNQQGGAGGIATPVIQECSYVDNDSELGEDVANSDVVLVRVTNSTSPYRQGGSLRPTRRTTTAERN